MTNRLRHVNIMARITPLPARGGGETVDAGDLKSPGETHEGSIPSRPTSRTLHQIILPLPRFYQMYDEIGRDYDGIPVPRNEITIPVMYTLLTRSKLPGKICFSIAIRKGTDVKSVPIRLYY